MTTRFTIALTGVLALYLSAAPTLAQDVFAHPENLKVLPTDTAPARLREVMKGFSQALHVRCNHCHVAKDANDLRSYDFASDDKAEKVRARAMLRMVETINSKLLPGADGREPEVHVTCMTCHRGQSTPELMTDRLLRTIAADGFTAARSDYLALRESRGNDGSFDFSEMPLLDAGTRLWPSDADNAARLFAFAAEQFPTSVRSFQTHAQALLQAGKADAAIAVLDGGRGRGAANDAQIALMLDGIRAQAAK